MSMLARLDLPQEALFGGFPMHPDLLEAEPQRVEPEISGCQIPCPICGYMVGRPMELRAVALDDQPVTDEQVDPADAGHQHLRPHLNSSALQEEADSRLASGLGPVEVLGDPLVTLRRSPEQPAHISNINHSQMEGRLQNDQCLLGAMALGNLRQAVVHRPDRRPRLRCFIEVLGKVRRGRDIDSRPVHHVRLSRPRSPEPVNGAAGKTTDPPLCTERGNDDGVRTREGVPAPRHAGDEPDRQGSIDLPT